MRDSSGISVLQILTEFRDVTLKVCLACDSWRRGSGEAGFEQRKDSPRVFFWHGENYLLKCCRDIDFLSGCDQLVAALKVPREKMIHNPLMLPNTLDENSASLGRNINGAEREEHDVDREITDPKKKAERKALRVAERILLLEEKFHADVGGLSAADLSRNQEDRDSDDYYDDEEEDDEHNESESYASLATEQSENYEGELMNWYDKAQAQLLALSQPISGYSKFKSRQLGDSSFEKKEHKASAANFQQEPENHYPAPRRLTEILSTNFSPTTFPIASREAELNNVARRVSIAAPRREDFGESTYTPGAVPLPVSQTMDRATVIEHARRKSTLMPKGPQNVQSRLGLGRKLEGFPIEENSQEALGLVNKSPPPKEGNVIKKVKKRRSRSGVGAKKRSGDAANDGGEKVYTAGEIAGSISSDDLKALMKVENPRQEMSLVGAAMMIMLSTGKAVPKDVSWGGFKKEASSPNFITVLLTSDGGNIASSPFKARALRKFLVNDKFLPENVSQANVACGKLAAWTFAVLRDVKDFDWPGKKEAA